MTKVVVSEKQIVKINEFMDNYLGIKYDGDEKLTHRNMEYYLYDKGHKSPKRISFDKVTKEKLLTGEYIVVKDEANQILIYKNPRKSLDLLYSELNSIVNKEMIKNKREEYLSSMNLVETDKGILDLEEEKTIFVKCKKRLFR